MGREMEVTCTYVENCAGIEMDEASMPLNVGDKFKLRDNMKLRLPLGRAEFTFPDCSILRLEAPASITLSSGDLKGMTGAFRMTVFLGKIWSMVSDWPLHVVEKPEERVERAVAGVRG